MSSSESEGTSSSEPTSPGDLTDLDVIDVGEFSWSQRLRPKPKIHGKYLRGDVLGQGTFAKVYEVLDIFSLERAAVKIFDLQKIDRKFNREEMISMVNQEITLLSGCDHPNVIKLIGVHRSRPSKLNQKHKQKEKDEKSSTDDNNSDSSQSQKDLPPKVNTKRRKNPKRNKIWVYLEYCMSSVAELMELANPNQVKTLPLAQARKYFIDLLNGLEYLHSKGIFHKDIKPDNMLINVWDTIKLTDFSVSFVIDIFTQSDICHNTYGTIAYQPPEVINSVETGFSASACDVWSSGVTFYVILTGRLPFSSKNGFIAMTESILQDQPQTNELLAGDPYLSNLIHSMLTKDPADRIKLSQILKHPWLRVDLPKNEPFINIPPRYANGDQYRSLTITSYLHELHYPLPNEQNFVTVSESSADEFNAKRKIPFVRSNRSPSRYRTPKRRPSFIQKISSGQIGRLLGVIGLNSNPFQKSTTPEKTDSNASQISQVKDGENKSD